jgi:hypothetical protein
MPELSDLDAAMMQPALSVPAVRRLGGGSIRLNDNARPLRVEGRDAVVYELRTPSGRILALRVLLRPNVRRNRTLAERYAALRTDPRLESLRGTSAPLPRDIQWIAEGIAFPGPDLQRIAVPLMAMERVPGRTMAHAVDRLCREGQSEPLALLADRWLETAATLERSGFTHGDLAADNLIVRPDGTIAVIDLDAAFWPSCPVAPEPSVTAPGYTHPSGAPHDPTQRDRFPALMLWSSLRILAHHPELRERWGDHPDRYGASLLWSQDDLRRPERSPVFTALEALDDASLQPLLEIVRRAIRFSAEETPPLSEIAERLDGLGFPRWASSGQPGRRSRIAAPLTSLPTAPGIDQATTGIDQIWDEDAAPLHHPDGKGPERQPDATRTMTLAEKGRRRAAAQRLAAAVASRDTTEALRLWQQVRAIPEAAAYAASLHNLVAHDRTDAIDRALRRVDDSGLLAAITEAELAGVAPSHEARAAVRAARERLSARADLREAIERRDYATIGDLQRSGKLACLGRLEASQARAVARSLAWPALERALATDDDAAIAAAADPALWRDEASLPAAAWQRVDLAQRRLRWMQEIRAALRKRDGSVLRRLLAAAPPGAEQRLTEVEGRRILRFTMREAAVARLERALQQGPDREVVAALAEFEAAAAPFTDVLDWAAVRGVVDRLSLADALRTAANANPPDTARLARLLPAARAALGDGQGSSGPDWTALEETVLRAAHLARLREAIAAGDDGRIVSAADPDPYGAASLLSEDEQDRLRLAMAHQQRRRA